MGSTARLPGPELLVLWLLLSFDVLGQTLETDYLGASFTLVINKVSFNVARQDCEQRGSTLARISNFAEHSIIRSFFDQVGLDNDVWIGRVI